MNYPYSNNHNLFSVINNSPSFTMDTQTHHPYGNPVPNQFQVSQSKEIPHALIQHSSSSTQIPPSELSQHFHTNVTMDDNDKGKSLQFLNDSNSIQLPNFPPKPLLFYLRDHELYYTSFYGPRYNENTIFIDYQVWYNSSEISFYSYLKLIKAYQTLVQDVSNHPVLIVMPTEYINYFKWCRRHLEY